MFIKLAPGLLSIDHLRLEPRVRIYGHVMKSSEYWSLVVERLVGVFNAKCLLGVILCEMSTLITEGVSWLNYCVDESWLIVCVGNCRKQTLLGSQTAQQSGQNKDHSSSPYSYKYQMWIFTRVQVWKWILQVQYSPAIINLSSLRCSEQMIHQNIR